MPHAVSSLQTQPDQPPPSATARSTRFWDRIAQGYAERPVAHEAIYQKKLDVTRQYFHPAMQVLELGCGTGSTAIAHAPHVKHIRATDVSTNMIEIARRKATAASVGNVSFEQASIDEVDAPDQSIDVVMAHSVLHLLSNHDEVIAKVHRMLKPGGCFVTSTACLGGMVRFFPLRIVVPIGRLFGRLPLVKFFTPAELTSSLTRAGFEIDYNWHPGPGRAVFIVAKKPG